MRFAVVVMAYKANTLKLLHPLQGKSLLGYMLTAIEPLDPTKVVIVTDEDELEPIRVQLKQKSYLIQTSVSYLALAQSPQPGIGYGIEQTRHILVEQVDAVLVMPASLPLLSTNTLQKMLDTYQSEPCSLVMLTVKAEHLQGETRVVRDGVGNVTSLVARMDDLSEQKTIDEWNAEAYLFNADWLWKNLENVPPDTEDAYYIANLVDIAVSQGKQILTELVNDSLEAIEVTNRVHLAEANTALRRRINRHWMESGVTIIDPSTTYIEPDVVLGVETVIYPNTHLLGKTTIGENCVIGPNSFVENASIGDSCLVRYSVVEDAVMENHVDIGPFGHLRKGAHLASGVHMGNFGEVKNSYLGPGTKMGHFSYLGDATTGTNVNVGAGTITCNYDGVNKNPTKIGNNTFIGSDTLLVAPVNVGANAQTGAGSVVTKNIPDNALAYGVPAKVKNSS